MERPANNLEWLQQRLYQYLIAEPAIKFAVLYGSASTSEQFRDVDIAVFVGRAAIPPSMDFDYAFELEQALKGVVPYPVDVRVINDAALPFRYNVSRGIPLVVHDEEAWADFREQTWITYLDFQPFAMRYLKEMVWTK